MALSITAHCIGCHACKLVCPQNAIRQAEATFVISHRCDECAEQSFGHQCASICPVENAILLDDGRPANPTGSLTPNGHVLQTLHLCQEGAV